MTELTRPGFIDDFGKIVEAASERLAAEQKEREQRAYEVDRARIDQDHEDTVQERISIAARAETLHMGWLASQVLLRSGVRENDWFRDVEHEVVGEPKGLLRRRKITIETRPRLALEGWKIYDFNHITPRRTNSEFSAAQRAITLVLQKDGVLSAVTSWDKLSKTGYDWEIGTIDGSGPNTIVPLHKDPMDDRALKSVWTKLERPYTPDGEQIGLGARIRGEKGLRLYADKDGEEATYRAGSHESHNRYGIEDRIRTALGTLVATHNVRIP